MQTYMQKNYDQFIKQLKQSLKEELPGLKSQMKMVPGIRQKEMESKKWSDDAKKAAVLICFYPLSCGNIHLALIRRNEYDGVHSGQISFPGGKVESQDRDIVHTALREAEEEINIQQDEVEVLGELSQVYIPPSNFIVQPVIGCQNIPPKLIPDPDEVSEILSISLNEILDPENRQIKNIVHREYSIIDVPCFYIRGHIIWGATAMMLSEVVDLINGN